MTDDSTQSLQSAMAEVTRRQSLFALDLNTDPRILSVTRKAQEPICIPLIIDLHNPDTQSVVVFPTIEAVPLTEAEKDKYRSRYDRTDLIMPDPRIVRTPGEEPKGWSSYFLGVDGSLDIALIQGKPYWMEKLTHGWYLSILCQNESSANGRWRFWMEAREHGDFVDDRPLPPLKVLSKPNERAIIQLKWALDLINPEWNDSSESAFTTLEYFFDYLLYSLGSPLVPEPPEDIWRNSALGRSGATFDMLYQSFDSTPLLLYPYPYFGWLLSDVGNEVGDLRYEPPMPVDAAAALVQQLFPNRRKDYREELFLDPEIDNGITLAMLASNYTANIALTTTDPLAVKAAHLTSFFYVPWAILPAHWIDNTYITDDSTRAREAQRRYELILQAKGLPEDYLETHQDLTDWRRTQPVQLLATLEQVEPQPLIDGTTWKDEAAANQLPAADAERRPLIAATDRSLFADRFKLKPGKDKSAIAGENAATSDQPPAILTAGADAPLDPFLQQRAPEPIELDSPLFETLPPPPIMPTQKMTGRLKVAPTQDGERPKLRRREDEPKPLKARNLKEKRSGRKRGTNKLNNDVQITRKRRDEPRLLDGTDDTQDNL